MRTTIKKFVVIKYKTLGFVKEFGDKKTYWNWGVFSLQESACKFGDKATREQVFKQKYADEYRVNHPEEFIIDITEKEAQKIIAQYGLVLSHADESGEVYDTPAKTFKAHWQGRAWQKYEIL